jgi:hypothetical protein
LIDCGSERGPIWLSCKNSILTLSVKGKAVKNPYGDGGVSKNIARSSVEFHFEEKTP